MLRIVALSSEHLEAVRHFNERMRHAGPPLAFELPEGSRAEAGRGLISSTDYIVADESGVHGGILAVDHPAVLSGQDVQITNYQSPLSEGIIEPRYRSAGMLLLRFAERRSPLAYMVGMGSDSSPLARLLKAAGWSVGLSRFQFRVHRPRRFLSELRLAHSSRFRSMVSSAAGWTGAASAGLAILQRRRSGLAGFSAQIEKEWGDWADVIWKQFRERCSFAIRRDAAVLPELFPASDSRLVMVRIDHHSRPAGWAACFDSPMRNHPHFGDLRVGSILDCVAAPEAMAATAILADTELARRGVDVVITNQTHRLWCDGFSAAGFLAGPSNYVVALSPALAARCGDRDSIHVTRGDGDGRIHL